MSSYQESVDVYRGPFSPTEFITQQFQNYIAELSELSLTNCEWAHDMCSYFQ